MAQKTEIFINTAVRYLKSHTPSSLFTFGVDLFSKWYVIFIQIQAAGLSAPPYKKPCTILWCRDLSDPPGLRVADKGGLHFSERFTEIRLKYYNEDSGFYISLRG